MDTQKREQKAADNFLKRYKENENSLKLIIEKEKKGKKINKDQKKKLEQQNKKIEDIIESIKDNNERIILDRFYIEGQTVEKIASCLNYCDSQIYRIKRKALEKVFKKYGGYC